MMRGYFKKTTVFLLTAILFFLGNGGKAHAAQTLSYGVKVLQEGTRISKSGTYTMPSPGIIVCTEGFAYVEQDNRTYESLGLTFTDGDRVSLTSHPGGTFNVTLHGADNAIIYTNDQYDIEMATCLDAENNYTFSQATPISMEDPRPTVWGLLSDRYDEDYYSFELKEPRLLAIVSHHTYDIPPYMFFAVYQEKKAGSVTYQERLPLETVMDLYGAPSIAPYYFAPGKYYVRIRSFTPEYGAYRFFFLSFDGGKLQFETEGNDTFETANRISLNEAYSGSCSAYKEDEYVDLDYYTFTLPVDTPTTVQVSPASWMPEGLLYGAAYRAKLYRDNGGKKELVSEINETPGGNASPDPIVADLKKGTYYLVFGDEKMTFVPYEFSVTIPQVLPTGLQITSTKKNLAVGETATLTPVFTPGNTTVKEVTWASSASDVVKVENGTVTALKEGTATITATSKADPKITASLLFTVKNGLQSMKLVANKTVLKPGETATVTLQTLPENFDIKNIVIALDKEGIIEITSPGVIRALKEGTATLRGKEIGGNGIETSLTFTVVKEGGVAPADTTIQNPAEETTDLKYLKVSKGAKLNRKFRSGTSKYKITLNPRTSKVTVRVAPKSKNAVVYMNDRETRKITLKLKRKRHRKLLISVEVGDNLQKDYVITVRRK